ncbi:MAG: alpha/beta fold hydrolase [Acidimicrobiia bacterium]|nr:alpha/beta fold hydrolase [Acidimicrobiia bacterium]
MAGTAFERHDVEFHSTGEQCAAWLYRPHGVPAPPVLVMAHGFGALRTFGLEPFAEEFCSRGLAVLVFDYRTFGDSDGRPRQLVSPHRHVEDWHAAIAHVRALEDVDSTRIGLWGTSYSGGHTLVAAARDGAIRCVVSQVPFVGVTASNMPPLASFARLVPAVARDLLRARRGGAPCEVGLIGEPGDTALLTYPGWNEAYTRLVPADTQWVNATPARTVPEILAYRPARVAADVRCPVLFLTALQDRGTPAALTQAVAVRMRRATVRELDCDHFDVYDGPQHEEAKKLAGDFLAEHMVAPDS